MQLRPARSDAPANRSILKAGRQPENTSGCELVANREARLAESQSERCGSEVDSVTREIEMEPARPKQVTLPRGVVRHRYDHTAPQGERRSDAPQAIDGIGKMLK